MKPRPALMGILNVTPDSFSGDGSLGEQAIARAKMLADAGADILDIGAESTRPGATPLTHAEEWARLEPVIASISTANWRDRVRISIDTRHAATAAAALPMGVDIINDVGGLNDDAMCRALEEYECDVVVMHALSLPADPNFTWPADVDAVAEMLKWKAVVASRAKAHGIATHRLIYDPGIGFGKTAEQSLALIERASELKASGGRWLFGHSRKSFMKLFTDAPPEGRDALTIEYSLKLADAGVDYLRVHDIAGHVKRLAIACT